MRHVVVIGAGMAGLSGARELTKSGVSVVLLERDAHVGGRVHTEQVEGFTIEVGAQFVANFYTNTVRLIRDVGLDGDMAPLSSTAAIVRSGRVHGLRPVRRLLRSPVMSGRSKLASLNLIPPILRHWRRLDFHALHRAHRFDTESAADYARAHLTQELLDCLIRPMLGGTLAWTPERTSQAMLFVLLKAAVGMKLFGLVHGLGQLPERLAAELDVRCNAPVEQITRDKDGGYLVHVRAGGSTSPIRADGVLCATPALAVPSMFPELTDRQRSFFENVRYCDMVVTAIATGRRLPSAYYSLLFPSSESTYLATATLGSARYPGRAPLNRDIVKMHASGAVSDELLRRDENGIRDALTRDLARAGPEYDPRPDELFSRTYRWQPALPEFGQGYLRRLQEFTLGGFEPARVAFAGDYLGGPFIEGAVTSGQAAARRLLRNL